MARIKSLRLKNKRYIFRVLDNEKDPAPMACVFQRFPLPDEDFPLAEPIEIADEFKRRFAEHTNKEEAIRELLQAVMPAVLENVKRQRIDYVRFMRECVERFEDLEYDGRKIESLDDFCTLPADLEYMLAQDAYIYANERDRFTLVEKNDSGKR